MSLIVFDLDNTLVDAKPRLKAAGQMPDRKSPEFINWLDRVQSDDSLAGDDFIPQMKELYKSLRSDDEYKIVFLTAREEKYRDVTLKWIQYNLGYVATTDLFMRSDDDCRSTVDYKHEQVKNIKQEFAYDKPSIVFDDDLEGDCSSMWVEEGFVHLKVFYK